LASSNGFNCSHLNSAIKLLEESCQLGTFVHD